MNPAIVAESIETKVPPIMALSPNSVSNFLLLGAKIPIPPIWMPIEAKLAKPQKHTQHLLFHSNYLTTGLFLLTRWKKSRMKKCI